MNKKLVLSVAVGALIAGASLAFAADKATKADDKMMAKDTEMMKMADDKMAASGEQAKPAMDEAMMAKWKEYSTPNENHRVLDALVGDWTYTLKHWMSPTSPAEESIGTSSYKWIMDGRFLEETVQGTTMGQPMTGTSITGYDNAGKEYQSIWFDSTGTGMMITRGSYDAATKTLTQTGDFNCPFRGTISMRWVTKLIDANTFSFEMYSPDEAGKELRDSSVSELSLFLSLT